MYTFPFQIKLAHFDIHPGAARTCEIIGSVIHSHNAAIEVGGSFGGASLRLGCRLLRSQNNIAFEDRASFEGAILTPAIEHQFKIVLAREAFSFRGGYVLLIDFLWEGEYWFFERTGLEPFKMPLGFLRSGSGESVTGLRYTSQSDTNHLIERTAHALGGIALRFTSAVAVEFAYIFILRRRADVGGLTSKIRLIETAPDAFLAIAREMFSSEEYLSQARSASPDPDQDLANWGRRNG